MLKQIAWMLFFTFVGWMIGATLYWHYTETPAAWQDYLFFGIVILGSLVITKGEK